MWIKMYERLYYIPAEIKVIVIKYLCLGLILDFEFGLRLVKNLINNSIYPRVTVLFPPVSVPSMVFYGAITRNQAECLARLSDVTTWCHNHGL